MPEGKILEFSGLTKRFGSVTAVEDFSARVEPGVVTGFLGPNGAGKTTTLRILLGLVRASAGQATIGGVPYAELRHPLQTVGAALEASSFHPARTAHNHLKIYAQAAGLPLTRIDEALALVGLEDVADRKAGGFSLGMRQRLGLAYALLGDPGVLVLDEPTNGLDPEGIKWMRGLLRTLAAQGRTVLISSHLLAEVQQTVDSLVIISRGRLVYQGSLDELSHTEQSLVVVDSPDRAGLVAAFNAAALDFDVMRSGLNVRGHEPAELGRIALAAGVPLSSLGRKGGGIEEIFLELVSGVRTHPSAGAVDSAGSVVSAAAVDSAASAGAVDSAAGAGSVVSATGAGVDGAGVGLGGDAEGEAVAEGVIVETVGGSEEVIVETVGGHEPEVEVVVEVEALTADDLDSDTDPEVVPAAPVRAVPSFDSLLLGPRGEHDDRDADEEGGAVR